MSFGSIILNYGGAFCIYNGNILLLISNTLPIKSKSKQHPNTLFLITLLSHQCPQIFCLSNHRSAHKPWYFMMAKYERWMCDTIVDTKG